MDSDEDEKGQPATRGAKAATREPDPTDTTKGLTLRIIQNEATTHAEAASRIHELCRRALTAPLPGKSGSKAQLSPFQPVGAGRQVIVSHTKIDVLTLTSEAIQEHLQQPDSPEWDPVDEEEELVEAALGQEEVLLLPRHLDPEGLLHVLEQQQHDARHRVRLQLGEVYQQQLVGELPLLPVEERIVDHLT